MPELQAAVMLVANGYADHFDLESLLKLQRKIHNQYYKSSIMRSSNSKKSDRSRLIKTEIPLGMINPLSKFGIDYNAADRWSYLIN